MYDSALNTNSQYKSLLISAKTTVDEVISLLLTCSNSKERPEQFSLYEVCKDKEQQRKLHPDDRPLLVQQTWQSNMQWNFLIRRNPDYLPLSRRKVCIRLVFLNKTLLFVIFRRSGCKEAGYHLHHRHLDRYKHSLDKHNYQSPKHLY